MKKVLLIFSLFLCVATFTALLPYPCFSRYTNISEREMLKINNFHETELSASTNQKEQVLDLDFSQTNQLLPVGSIFEIFDIKTGQSFFAERIGGLYHFDIQPAGNEDKNAIFQIALQNNLPEKKIWSWTRHPVLVKINDFAFLPASLAFYPHGYCVDSTGHFCLHFAGSRMDGTKKVDDSHQKNVSFAKKYGKEFLENF